MGYVNNDKWENYLTTEIGNDDKVPFAVFESLGDRLGQSNKRLFILSIILTVLLLITNIGWLYYESQYQVEATTMIDAEQDGDLNILGGGNINYGTTSSDNKNP